MAAKRLSKKRMKKLMDEIKFLQEKDRTEEEESLYLCLNSELTGLPEKMFTKEYSDKLMDLITKTDKLIKTLEGKGK